MEVWESEIHGYSNFQQNVVVEIKKSSNHQRNPFRFYVEPYNKVVPH